MKVSPTEATKLTSLARSTIYKDMNEGRLSYSLNKRGKRTLEVIELERVYGNLNLENKEENTVNTGGNLQDTNGLIYQASLLREIEILKEQISQINSSNITTHEILQNQIKDLKNEREKWQELSHKMTFLLEGQVKQTKGFFSKFFRK
jgi:predicted site-specific integrase-resolvase